MTVERALESVRSSHGVDFSRARARAGFSRGHLIDVVLSLPGGVANEREHRAAQSLLGAVLGEARTADWVGEVRLEPAPRGGLLKVLDSRAPSENFFPVSELPSMFERAITGLYAGLPDKPLWSMGGELLWTMLEASAERADDYPAQDDLLLASTYLPEMLKCFLGGAPFSSNRFSRHGELFAYLKVESSSRIRASPCRRGAFSKTLSTRRSSASAQDAWSGADSEFATPTWISRSTTSITPSESCSTVARRVGLPERCWVLFCDSELEDEWAPVHPNGPAPPREP